VVDVGGYIGDFSIYAARRMNASGVIVYEPTSEHWRMLVDSIAGHLSLRPTVCGKR
jgi:FkbM family methyltransferase